MSEQRMTKELLAETLHSVSVGAYGNRAAKEGYVYQCVHCGKRSRDKYGDQSIDRGFDESCMLNSVLVPVKP